MTIEAVLSRNRTEGLTLIVSHPSDRSDHSDELRARLDSGAWFQKIISHEVIVAEHLIRRLCCNANVILHYFEKQTPPVGPAAWIGYNRIAQAN